MQNLKSWNALRNLRTQKWYKIKKAAWKIATHASIGFVDGAATKLESPAARCGCISTTQMNANATKYIVETIMNFKNSLAKKIYVMF